MTAKCICFGENLCDNTLIGGLGRDLEKTGVAASTLARTSHCRIVPGLPLRGIPLFPLAGGAGIREDVQIMDYSGKLRLRDICLYVNKCDDSVHLIYV